VRIEKTVTIARTRQDVWAYISDLRNDPEWCEKVDSVEQTVGDGPGLGAKYRVMHRPRPRKPAVALDVAVVQFDPPLLMGLREEDDDAVFNVIYRLEAGAGTQLTQTDDIDWKISKLAYPVARAMVTVDLARQFAALKRQLEPR
jgi:hypothetical protein